MKATKKMLSIILTFVFTMFSLLCSMPVQAGAKKTVVPEVQFASAPVTEYTVGDRIQFNINSPNFGGKVEYRVVLWNDSQKSYGDLWNEGNGYSNCYYTKWQPTGNTIFTLGWPIFEPGNYRITVYAKRVGVASNKAVLIGMNCDSYKESVAFTVKPKITFLDKEGKTYGSSDVNKLETYKGDIKVTSNNIVLSNANVEGDLYISGDNAVIKNVSATGKIVVDPGKDGSTTLEAVIAKNIEILSGGSNSIHIKNVQAETMNVSSSTPIRVEADGDTEIVSTSATGYVIFDRKSGTYGTITIIKGSNGVPVIEFRGDIKDKVEVETTATIKTGKNSKISNLVIATKNSTDTVKLEGKFAKVEINSEAKVEVAANTKIENIVANKNAEINLDKTAVVDKVDKGSNTVVVGGEGQVGASTPPVSGGSTSGGGGWYPPVDTTIKVSAITVTGDATVANGQTLQLGATVTPTNATTKTVTWSVATLVDGTATIDSNGLLTATKAGTVTVKAVAKDGSGKSGELVVTIEASPLAWDVNPITAIAKGTNNSNPYQLMQINYDRLEAVTSIELTITDKKDASKVYLKAVGAIDKSDSSRFQWSYRNLSTITSASTQADIDVLERNNTTQLNAGTVVVIKIAAVKDGKIHIISRDYTITADNVTNSKYYDASEAAVALTTIKDYATNNNEDALTADILVQAGVTGIVNANVEAYKTAIAGSASIADLPALQTLISGVNEEVLFAAAAVIAATSAVATAEGSKLQAAVTTAQGLVTALPDGATKTALQARIDAVQAIIDSAALNTLKDAIAGATYMMPQEEIGAVPSAEKQEIERVISGLALDGVTTEVTKVLYTKAVEGTEGDIDGTNGTYTFIVKLSKGAAIDTTETLTMTVTATAYVAPDADQAAPTGLAGVAPTSVLNDGKITGTTTAMEYKLASAEDSTYATCSATETTVAAGNYVVRLAAKTGFNAGATAAVTVVAYVAPLASGIDASVEAKSTPESGKVMLTVSTAVADASHAIYYRVVDTEPTAMHVGDEVTVSDEWKIVSGTDSFEVAAVDGKYIEIAEFTAADSKVTKWGKTGSTDDGYTAPANAANVASVLTVKGLIEGATYSMTQANATDEPAVKTAIESVITGLALDGVTPVVTAVLYTPAVAGTEADADGTNGTYTFTVALSKGADTTLAEATTETLTMTVTATAYVTPVTPAAPSVTADDEANTITGLDLATMEYSLDDGSTWVQTANPDLTGVKNVKVRVKAVDGVSNASAATDLAFTTNL